jgi:hypothetical protein
LDYLWFSHKDRVFATKYTLETRGHTAPHTGVAVQVQLRSNSAVDVLERPQIAREAMYGALGRNIIEAAEAIQRAMHMAQGRGLTLHTSRPMVVATAADRAQLDNLAERPLGTYKKSITGKWTKRFTANPR